MTEEHAIKPHIHLQSWVVSSDGQELGRVSELGGQSFKVSAPMVSDYWLKKDYVAEAKEGSVSLSLTKEELLTVKQDSPDERANASAQE
jgi:hypothetical protein